jgi:hypothetical protein
VGELSFSAPIVIARGRCAKKKRVEQKKDFV